MTAAIEYCPNCSLWHSGGPCDHDSEAPCFTCNGKRGYRWLGDDRKEVKPRTRCWACWWSSMGMPALPVMGSGAQSETQGSAQ